jgi:radical SAM protein with 4Fe4S-binding SPASM domain
MDDFLGFYRQALDYLLHLNITGTPIDEAYTALLLTYILTPFPSHYVDLRSPTGAGLGTLVYNYDGHVYASDESRMLAEMGDTRFCLGSVETPYRELMQSEAMQVLLAAGVAESLPECADCAFLPYCGADPVYALATQGDPVGHRPTSAFCTKQTGMFRILFRLLHDKDPDVLRVFLGWITQQAPHTIVHSGFAG